MLTSKIIYRYFFLLLLGLCFIPNEASSQDYTLDNFISLGNTAALGEATDLAVGSDTSLYVLYKDKKMILKLNRQGELIESIKGVNIDGKTVSFDEPNAITVDKDNTLYIADDSFEKIFIKGSSGKNQFIGKPGKDLGELKDLDEVDIDNQGYMYVISKKQQHIVIFDPQGNYLTWIKSGDRNFEEISAIDFDRQNNLYVLEDTGPDVHVFDTYGNYLKSFSNLSSNSQVAIEEAHDLIVTGNGDFLILDKEKSNITHFGSNGEVKGKFGTQGSSAKGVFENANALAKMPQSDSLVYVLDKEGRTIQSFRLPLSDSKESEYTNSDDKKIRINPLSKTIPNFIAITDAGNSLYMVPESDTEKLIKFNHIGEKVYTLKGDEFIDLALDSSGNIYAADVGNDEIIMYDSTGVLIRKFGQEISEELDDPTSVATLSDGSVLVVDSDNASIKKWSKSGVFEETVLRASNSVLSEPAKIRTDNQDNIYIWDKDKNTIFRYDDIGDQVNFGMLALRSPDGPDEKGEIGDFEIDPLGQIHVFNVTTNQYEIFKWNTAPSVILRYGRTGEGLHSFENFERFGFDTRSFSSYVVEQKGDKVSVIQFVITPPAPSENFQFDLSGEKITVSIPVSNHLAVTSYGLARLNNQNNIDTVISTSVKPVFRLPEIDSLSSQEPSVYALFTSSPTAKSKLTSSFTDYYSLANYHFKKENYDLALSLHRQAVNKLNVTDEVLQHLATQYAELGNRMLEDADLDAALRFGRASISFDGDSEPAADLLGSAYQRNLSLLAENKKYDQLFDKAKTWVENGNEVVDKYIYAALDTVGSSMLTGNEVESLQTAKNIYSQLIDWEGKKPTYAYRLAKANNQIYNIKHERGAPGFEQKVYLNDAFKWSKKASDQIDQSHRLYHPATLMHYDILLKQGKNQEVIEAALQNLNNDTNLSPAKRVAYRKKLAEGYTQKGDYESAVVQYQKILTTDKSNITYKKQLAEALIRQGAYEDAKSLYQEMLFNDRGNSKLIAKIGEIELLQGNFAEASFQLEKVIEKDAGMIRAYPLIAQAYEGASNFSKAIEYYKIALNQKSTQLERARSQSAGRQRVDTLKSDIRSYNASMAHIYSQMGEYDKAIDRYKKWTELASNNSKAWHGLGTAYMAYGRVYDAVKALNTALKLNPTSSQIDQDLSRARDLRDKISENRPPVEFLEVNTVKIFPSLYKNYDDANKLPIGEVVLSNNTDLPIREARLTFFIEGVMDSPTEQSMKPLLAFSNTEINLAAVFNKSILENTEDQNYQAQLTLTYTSGGDEKTIEKSAMVKILGRNRIQWNDKRRLAAFVSPSNESILDYVKSMDVYFRDKPTYNLNGNIRKAIQIYSVLHENDFTYSVDPETKYSLVSTNTTLLDYLQYPAQSLMRKAGDCDDLVAVLCGLMENSGISTSYIDVPGHVFMAFDSGIEPDELSDAGLEKKDVIIEKDKVWIPVESTLLGSAGFNEAWKSAAERYRKEMNEGNFPELISLSEARNIYTPSTYIPEKYNPQLPTGEALDSEYKEQLNMVYKNTKKQIIEELEQRYEENPQNLYVINRLGTMYARSDNMQKAKSIIESGLSVAPENATLLNNLGNINFKLENYKEALKNYKKASESDPEDGEILINLARTYHKLKNSEKAEKTFNKAVSKNQKLADKYQYLAKEI